VPTARWGKTADGNIHVADWMATILTLAGLEVTEDDPAVPKVDSIDVWPVIVGTSDGHGPRNEIPLRYSDTDNVAIIVGDFKLVKGRNAGGGLHWGPNFPNASGTPVMNDSSCVEGCLFNLTADEGEYHNLKGELPDTYTALEQRILEIGIGVYQSDENGTYDYDGAIRAAKQRFNVSASGWWWGPWLS
jgi:arylsulfatase B